MSCDATTNNQDLEAIINMLGEGEFLKAIVESPYAKGRRTNIRYGRRVMRWCLLRGIAPMMSHLLYTQRGVLRDEVPAERARGIRAGLAWGGDIEPGKIVTLVFTDRGISEGMQYGIEHAKAAGRPVCFMRLPGWKPGLLERVEICVDMLEEHWHQLALRIRTMLAQWHCRWALRSQDGLQTSKGLRPQEGMQAP